MNEDYFWLAALGPADLAGAANGAAGRPVRDPVLRPVPVDYDSSSPGTAGLWRVEVTAEGADVGTLFVKALRHTRLWPMLAHLPDDEARTDFTAYYPWHFELDIHQSGIDAVLPDGLRAPTLHQVTRPDDDHIVLWWEYIAQRPSEWQLGDYRLAATLLGRLAARRRSGAEVNNALPEISRHRDSALRFYTTRRVLAGILPALRDGQVWGHPALAAALREVDDPGLPSDMLALAGRLPDLLDELDELPQTYAHGDASPQNLLLPAAEPGTIVAIDWGFGTLLPVGFDLGQLLVGLAHATDSDLAQLPAIDAEIFPAYLDGLACEDYKVDPAQVRAGYLGSLAARSALCATPIELLGSEEVSAETIALLARRLRLTRLMLELTR
jgi:hypothetical protein